jgi:large subunit ribosomal protein L29
MKPSEFRELTIDVLKEKVTGWNEELFNLRFQSKLGQLTNALRFRTLRRDIARAKTIIQEKTRAGETSKKIKK